jgi:hypothetical protein
MDGLKSVPVGWEAMNSFLTQQYPNRHELWLGATVPDSVWSTESDENSVGFMSTEYRYNVNVSSILGF